LEHYPLIKLFKKNRSKESETVWMLLWKYAELVYVPNTDQKQYAPNDYKDGDISATIEELKVSIYWKDQNI
jgi:hypothetical protein